MRLHPLETRHALTGAVRRIGPALLAEVYLAPRWPGYAPGDALQDKTAPWSASLTLAPKETGQAVALALRELQHSVEDLTPDAVDASALEDGRAKRHLLALLDLWRRLDGGLPEDLWAARHVLSANASNALDPLPVISPPCAFASTVEAALDAQLTAHHGRIEQEVTDPAGPIQAFASALGTTERSFPEDNVTVITLRDAEEEAAFAAARAQRLLDDGLAATERDICILVPNRASYIQLAHEAFAARGLRLSETADPGTRRDRAGELASALIATLEATAPNTALATIWSSPAMPWEAETGLRMIRQLFDWGRTAAERAAGEDHAPFFRNLLPVATPAQLTARILSIIETLSQSPDAGEVVDRLHGLLPEIGEEIDWRHLRRKAAEGPVADCSAQHMVDGCRVLRETELPQETVRHLLVLGASGQSYPGKPPTFPLFTEGEIAQIGSTLGLRMPTRAERFQRGLERMRRQLASATQSVTVSLPARDLAGGPERPSTLIQLIARAAGAETYEDITRVLRTELAERWEVTGRPVLPVALPPAPPADGRLGLGRDLTRLGTSGEPRRQSPSSLETLMVSPLAWLLKQTGATELLWTTEVLDARLRGTLLHGVLERLFPEGETPPDARKLESRLIPALDAAIAEDARWLASERWQTERRRLARAADRSARDFAAFLEANGARVVASEFWLEGHLEGLPIRGRADVLVATNDGTLIVVDHKSGTAQKRRKAMQDGWDIQIALYRDMLAGPDCPEAVAPYVAAARIVTAAYHTLGDGAVMTDIAAPLARAEGVTDDPSAAARCHLNESLSDLTAGTLVLNRQGDAKRLEKERSIRPYALGDSPLIGAFSVIEEDGDA